MKAMVLAAGKGVRLKPLTDQVPKALIEVGGVPLLELVIRRLIQAGVGELVVNVFHLADQVERFLRQKCYFGIRIEVSREEVLLETGGGLQKAAAFFDDGKPFFLHNVDIVTDLDLGRLYRVHAESPALATLAVRRRASSRLLLFDASGALRGRRAGEGGRTPWRRGPVPKASALAFDGIHVVSPGIFAKLSETGVFSITDAYLRLAGQGERIQAFRADEYFWEDIGSLDKLERARRRVQEKGLAL